MSVLLCGPLSCIVSPNPPSVEAQARDKVCIVLTAFFLKTNTPHLTMLNSSAVTQELYRVAILLNHSSSTPLT